MLVKDVIRSAMRLVGRGDICELLSSEGQLPEEQGAAVQTMLYCYNAVEDELARRHFPLTATDKLTSNSGTYYFARFYHTPIKINRVYSGGARVKYKIFSEYLKADYPSVEVEYDYSPAKKSLTGSCEFEGLDLGEMLFAYGCAAEYSLINGEIRSAELWESKYRQAVDGARKNLPQYSDIPPRRWV